MAFIIKKKFDNKINRKFIKDITSKGCSYCPLSVEEDFRFDPIGSDNPLFYVVMDKPVEQDYKLKKTFGSYIGRRIIKVIADSFTAYNRKIVSSTDVLSYVRFGYLLRAYTRNKKLDSSYAFCINKFIEDVEKTDPKIIVVFGASALGRIANITNIRNIRGRPFPYNIGGKTRWIIGFDDPYKLIDDNNNYWGKTFSGQLVRVFDYNEAPNIDKYKEIECSKKLPGTYVNVIKDSDFNKVIEAFSILEKSETVGFDIETTSKEKIQSRFLRPYGNGSSIISIAFSSSSLDYTISIGINHPECSWSQNYKYKLYYEIKKFLENKKIKHIAHNLSYELEWLKYHISLRLFPSDRWGDTQAQAYVLGMRMASLDDTVKVCTGIDLKSISNINVSRLIDTSIDKVLLYNALDSYFTDVAHKVQNKIIEKAGLVDVYKDQVSRIPAAVGVQYRGLIVDQEENKAISKYLNKKEEELLHKINSFSEVEKYKIIHGGFNPLSNDDVLGVLINFFKIEKEKLVYKNKVSVGKEVLEALDNEFCDYILELRSINKMNSTYVKELSEDGEYLFPDGKVHTNLITTLTTTRRLSSKSPNSQNFPKHKYSFVRKQIIPAKNETLLSVDYGQIEARVIAAGSRDKYYVDALWNGYDVHAEWGIKLRELYPQFEKYAMRFHDGVPPEKAMRQEAKNKLVFPLFFGAKLPSVSAALSYPQDKMAKIIDEFWSTFSGVKKYQENVIKQYNDFLYVESLTGFRRYAPIEQNQIINSPIQGTASDITVKAMEILSEIAETEDLPYLQPCLNIHDDLTFRIPDAVFNDAVEYILYIMSYVVLQYFPFMCVPLLVEASKGKNWQEMEDFIERDSTYYGFKRNEH